MNKKLTFLLALTFLFLFSSVSFSQTFKCEFFTEKFKNGKSNQGECSGDPEIVFSSGVTTSPRTNHCEVDSNIRYEDFLDFVVDLDMKFITYSFKSGMTNHGIDKMVLYEKTRGNNDEKKLREEYRGSVVEYDQIKKVISTQTFTQLEDGYKGEKTTSHLITYTQTPKDKNEEVYTLFIPENGKSIISKYNIMTETDKSSWINMKFGKCVKTSK